MVDDDMLVTAKLYAIYFLFRFKICISIIYSTKIKVIQMLIAGYRYVEGKSAIQFILPMILMKKFSI